jgi:uncharacterized protein YdhG (YjbR/CyaY superfamily)
MADTKKSTGKASASFSAEEKAAMKERAAEVKAEKLRNSAEADTAVVLEKIAELDGSDRVIAERLHEIITTTAPGLAPKTWYGMPAYARDGKTVVFFQASGKFKTRYATLGFNDPAQLDDGTMWPTAYAITGLTAADEAAIAELIRKAAG